MGLNIDILKTKLYTEAVELLKNLIATPSISGNEDKAAQLVQSYLQTYNIQVNRHLNNVWAINKYFDPAKPSILLNSHIDTVKPNPGYTREPFLPEIEDNKLFGLGSNDAGGSVVCLAASFVYFYERTDLKYNFILALTAEEETSGKNGLECLLPQLPQFEFAIVGEPTQMHLAVAEKGLMVLDCAAHGKPGHAARNEGINAIEIAMKDINWFHSYKFPKVSEFLGPIKMTVTIINAGSQHNVVPDKCQFTVDIRVTECYSHEEIVETVRANIQSEILPRSMRLRPSSIDVNHPVVQAGLALGRETYGSPTTSDQALIETPSLKLGPGDSARSHSANEFIYLSDIKDGIEIYTGMLAKIV
jgi:acetylornithine deacetylase